MRTASATYPTMVPQIAQQWQADASGEAPSTAEGVGTVAEGDATEQSFDDTFAEITKKVEEKEAATGTEVTPPAKAPVTEDHGGLPAVGADGKPVPQTAQETPEEKAAREATAQETPEAKATREAAAAAAAAAPAPAAPPPSEDADKIMRALRGIMEAKPEPVPATQEAAYTPEQQTIVDNFTRDWPEIAQAQELIRAAEYRELTKFIFSQLTPVLNNLAGQTTHVAAVTHEQQIHQLIPDYATVRDPVVKWIGEQPAFLKPAYEAIATSGTAAQVAEMVDVWRASTGTVKPAAAAAAAAPVVKAPVVKPPASAAVVAALAPVRAQRASIPLDGTDPADFDAAFAKAAKDMQAVV